MQRQGASATSLGSPSWALGLPAIGNLVGLPPIAPPGLGVRVLTLQGFSLSLSLHLCGVGLAQLYYTAPPGCCGP